MVKSSWCEVVNVFPAAGYVQIAEHNYDVSNSEEGGVYAGFSYDIYKSGRFTLGTNASAYVLLSVGELETISLAPYLRFNF